MNNIKILEEFIKYFEAEATQRKYRRNISITVGEDDIEAIENLIQENKELEIKLKQIKSLKHIEEDLTSVYLNGFYEGESKWKSKLKEKIEELEKDVNDFEEYWSKDPRKFKKQKCVDYYKLEALKELLEEGE